MEQNAVSEVPTTPTEAPASVQSASAWKDKGTHTVTLPSGAVVSIKVPNLIAMVKGNRIPNELLSVVVGKDANAPATPEGQASAIAELNETAAFDEFIVPLTVVSPTITAEDVPDLPTADVIMLRQIATRQTDMDAVGHQLGGLETIESFRQFRGLDDSLQDLLGA